MKYYLGSITENYGEYEFSGQFLFQAKNEQERKKVLRKIEKNYRDSLDIVQDEATWQEIPESDFLVLRKYLSVL